MFFFDFIDGDYTTRDVDGCDLRDAEAARSEVLRALVAVFSSEPRDVDNRQVVCSVRDDSGTVIYRGVLTLSGTPFPNS